MEQKVSNMKVISMKSAYGRNRTLKMLLMGVLLMYAPFCSAAKSNAHDDSRKAARKARKAARAAAAAPVPAVAVAPVRNVPMPAPAPQVNPAGPGIVGGMFGLAVGAGALLLQQGANNRAQTALRNQNQNLNNQLIAANANVAGLQGQVNVHFQDVINAQRDANQLNGQRNQLNAQNAGLNVRLGRQPLLREIALGQARMQHRQAMQRIQNQLAQAQANVHATQARIAALLAERNGLAARIRRLARMMPGIIQDRNQLARLSRERVILDGQIQALLADKESNEDLIDALSRDLERSIRSLEMSNVLAEGHMDSADDLSRLQHHIERHVIRGVGL